MRSRWPQTLTALQTTWTSNTEFFRTLSLARFLGRPSMAQIRISNARWMSPTGLARSWQRGPVWIPLRQRLREALLKGDITALDEARVVLEMIPSTNQEMLRSECLSEEDVAARVNDSRKQADEFAAISDQAHDLGFSERLPLTRLEQLAECIRNVATLSRETDQLRSR